MELVVTSEGSNVVLSSSVERVVQGNSEEHTIIVSAEQGPPGSSAYDLALKGGFVGTQTDWLNSLQPDIDTGDMVTDPVAYYILAKN